MDIQRSSNAHAKKIRRIVYVGIAIISVAGVTYGVSRLRPAAPSVDKANRLTDEVKRGPLLIEVHGTGRLSPRTSAGFPPDRFPRGS